MKITPKPNIQQSQNNTIVNKIRTMFFKGKVKLKTLLCDVFEKKTVEPKSRVQEEGNEWLKDLISKEAFDPNVKREYTPPWITTYDDLKGVKVGKIVFSPEDQKLMDSLKTYEERCAYREKLILENRYKVVEEKEITEEDVARYRNRKAK